MDEMAADLAKEDFYGYKKMEERMKKDAKEAINRRIVEESMKAKPKGVIFKSVEGKKSYKLESSAAPPPPKEK